jgi:hypothetical protein
VLKLAIIRVHDETGEVEVLLREELSDALFVELEALLPRFAGKKHIKRVQAALEAAERRLKERTKEL